jgi:hypothetical protein
MSPTRPAPRQGLDPARLVAFVARAHGAPPDRVRLDVRPLRGGLRSAAVARVRARVVDGTGRARWLAFVVKRLDGAEMREATVYQSVLGPHGAAAPRLLGAEWLGAGAAYLYVECVWSRGAGPGPTRAALAPSSTAWPPCM